MAKLVSVEEITMGDVILAAALRECAEKTKDLNLRAIFKKFDKSGVR